MSTRPLMQPVEPRRMGSATAAATAVSVDRVPAIHVDARVPENPLFGTVAYPAGQGQLSAVVHWGDGTTSATLAEPTEADAGRQMIYTPHTYASPGRYAAVVDYADPSGRAVAVTRAAIVVTPNALTTPAIHAVAGRPFAGVVSTYRGSSPFHDTTVTIDWGDGSADSTATVSVVHGRTVISATHTYAAPGRYAVGVTGEIGPSSGGSGSVFFPDVIAIDNSTTGTAVVTGPRG